MKRLRGIEIGILLFAVMTGLVVATEPRWTIENAGGDTVAWINDSGTFNLSEDLQCSNCINPEDVNDIDDADIETDHNTYVDVAGDEMVGLLAMEDANITFNTSYGLTFGDDKNCTIAVNGTGCLIIDCTTSEHHIC